MTYKIIETGDYRFRADVDDNFNVCLHMDVYKWTPRVAKEIQEAYKDAKEAFYLEGFNALYTATQKPKFVELIAPNAELVEHVVSELGYLSVYIEKLGE